MRYALLALTLLDRLLRLAIEGSTPQRVPFVVKLFAARQSNLHLDPIPIEVDRQRNHGEAFFLDFPGPTLDLPLVEEKAPSPEGIVAGVTGAVITPDVATDQKCLAADKGHVSFLEIDLAGANRLDLGPQKFESRRILF
jgi:hypothetical protein